jgi:GTP cyclohydrolase II
MTALSARASRAAVQQVAATLLPTAHGTFTLHGFRAGDGTEHVALVLGDPSDAAPGPPLVRVHSECLTGDALGSWRCDCGDQLDAALRAVAAEGRGVVVYLRGQEGRGIGLLAKVEAYALQDAGADTVDANTALGLPVDAREYGAAAAVLAALGVPCVRLMSSNPAKAAALEAAGVEVAEVVGLAVPDRPTSAAYRRTKVERLGHLPVAAAEDPSAPDPSSPDPWDALVAAAHGGAPLPPGGEGPGTAGGDLLDRYAPLAAGGAPLVVAQVAQSLDGFTAARSGDARYVSGEDDREHLHRLRALVDVVVVGVRTVAADDPLLTVRACPGPHPVRAVLDPMGRAPLGVTLFGDPTAPVLWLVGAARAAAAAAGVADRPHVEVVPLTGCTTGEDVVGAVLAALAARGLHRVLVEGGATTVSRFLAAGALDRLWVTTAPVLVGDGVPGLRFEGTDLMADALRAPSRRFVLGEDVAVELDLAAVRAPAA